MSYIGNEPVISATRTITEITATAGQTVFNANGGYTVGYIDVVVNGAFLQASDFVATNGTSVTLNEACAANDDVKLVAWGTFTTSSSYTQAQADTLLAAKQPLNSELTAISASGNAMFKNRIINGAMMIDQRNAGASVTPTNGQYLVDRWYAGLTQSSKFTVQQSSTAPAGFTKSLLVTSSSAYSVGSGDTFLVGQTIEGYNCADLAWGSASAATVTLSFWVRSSLTGTFGGSINAADGATYSYPFSYTINAANTWEQKTVTIVGPTSTWSAGTTNNGAVQVRFGLGSGSTYSGSAGSWATSNYIQSTGSTSVVGTNGATFYITGVQLEKGSTATSFDYRPYGTELALCQRYFWKINNNGGTTNYALGQAIGATSANAIGGRLPVTMRTTPSLSWTGTLNQQPPGGGSYAVSAVSMTYATPEIWSVTTTCASGLTAGYASGLFGDATSSLSFSSEL